MADAKRDLGLRKGTRKYNDMLFEIFDRDVAIMSRFQDKPSEIVAYAIDHYEAGRGNELAEAIAKRF